MEALARPGILDLVAYVPGKPIQELERELGIAGAIKLASNENPLGPSMAALEAIAASLGELRPISDDDALKLRPLKYREAFMDEYWSAWERRVERAAGRVPVRV